jgi:hypothetical protein
VRPVILLAALAAVATLSRPDSAAAQTAPPARGTTIWVRTGGASVTELAGSVFAAPQFVIGTRRNRFALGLGVGVTRATSNDENDLGFGDTSRETLRATMFQAGPEFLLDVWRSPDARTRGNLAGGVAVGRVSLVDESVDTFGGQTTRSESRTTGTLTTLRLGIGGEHYFDRHFALGLEAGLRATLASGIEEQGQTGTSGFSAAGTYVALRAQVVFGR